jgi:hypothetical protein
MDEQKNLPHALEFHFSSPKFFDINMNAMLENLVIIDVEDESCAPKNPKKVVTNNFKY